MIVSWNEYLQTQGACMVEGKVVDFGHAHEELEACAGGLVMADLSHWGLIAFSGEEAQTFLHGQVTNDLRILSPEMAVFAGYCSAKGRMLANFLVLRRGDDILVLLPGEIRGAVQKRMSMFILRSRVTCRDASDEWVRLGLAGPGAATLLAEAAGLVVPASVMAVAHGKDVFAVRLGDERFDIFTTPASAPDLWARFGARARPVGAAPWDWLLVNAGVPSIVRATQDQFVPQMANMEVLHGVSFNKGCYPGQEIVARTQYLGKLKRRMFLAHSEAPAVAGDELYAASLPDQAAGLVANAALAPGGGYDLLAVLRIDSVQSGEVRLGGPGGPVLAFKTMPYAL